MRFLVHGYADGGHLAGAIQQHFGILADASDCFEHLIVDRFDHLLDLAGPRGVLIDPQGRQRKIDIEQNGAPDDGDRFTGPAALAFGEGQSFLLADDCQQSPSIIA